MKSLVVLSALVTITIAVPTYVQNGGYYYPQQIEELQRYKKSALQDLSPEAIPVHEDATIVDGEDTEGRTFKLKKKLIHQEPVHQQQHTHHHYPAHYNPGHHFRENEALKINAKEAIEEPTTDVENKNLTFSDQHLDLDKDIHNAKKAVDTIQNNFEEILKSSHGMVDWKNPESDKTFKQGLQTAKEALILVHKSFNDFESGKAKDAKRSLLNEASVKDSQSQKSVDDFENGEGKDALTSPSNEAHIHAIQETKERNNQWKDSQNQNDFKNIDAKDATSLTNDVPIHAIQENKEELSHWEASQNIMPKNAELLKNSEKEGKEELQEKKLKEADDLSEPDQEGHMSERIETIVAPAAPMALASHQEEPKNTTMPPMIAKNNMAKSDKQSDMEMKSAHVSAPTFENKNDLNVPLQNTDSKTKFAAPKEKSDIIQQLIPTARTENDQVLQSEKFESKALIQNLAPAQPVLKLTPKAATPQTLHKFEIAKPMHDLKHRNHPEARGAYNIAAPAYGAASHSAGGAASGRGGAVGVFPNANVGGCAIPLLLSCSPSVVSGSLSKYPSSGSNYAVPAYRGNIDTRMIEKRNTKKQPTIQDVKHTAILTQF